MRGERRFFDIFNCFFITFFDFKQQYIRNYHYRRRQCLCLLVEFQFHRSAKFASQSTRCNEQLVCKCLADLGHIRCQMTRRPQLFLDLNTIELFAMVHHCHLGNCLFFHSDHEHSIDFFRYHLGTMPNFVLYYTPIAFYYTRTMAALLIQFSATHSTQRPLKRNKNMCFTCVKR